MPNYASPCLTSPLSHSQRTGLVITRVVTGNPKKVPKGREAGRQAGRPADGGLSCSDTQYHTNGRVGNFISLTRASPVPTCDLAYRSWLFRLQLCACFPETHCTALYLASLSRPAVHCTHKHTHTETRSCGMWSLDACLSLSSLLDAAAPNLWLVPNKLESAPFSLGSRNAGQRRVTVPP